MMKIYQTVDKRLERTGEIGEGAWVSLTAPSSDEVRQVAATLDIEPADLQAALDPEESARVSLEDGYTVIIVDVPVQVPDKGVGVYTTIPLGILLTQQTITTVCAVDTQVLQDFFLPRQYGVKAEDRVRASDPSELRIMRDGENLYFKFRAFFPEKEGIRLTEKSDSEIFPYGEHAEIQLRVKGALYLFAFDANGNVYDAKNWDRSWNSSGRKIKARKDENSWEAVLSVPLKDLGFDLKKDAARPPELVLSRIRAGKQSGKQEESTYKGVAPNGEHIWSPLMMMD